jgi:hypothetical protein
MFIVAVAYMCEMFSLSVFCCDYSLSAAINVTLLYIVLSLTNLFFLQFKTISTSEPHSEGLRYRMNRFGCYFDFDQVKSRWIISTKSGRDLHLDFQALCQFHR